MTRSLRTHLLWLYVLLAVLSGIGVPALGAWLSLRGFREYQARVRDENLKALGDSLTDLYAEDGRWNRQRVMDVLRPAPQWGGMTIALHEVGGNVIYTLFPLRPANMGRNRRGRREPQDFPSLSTEQLVVDLTLNGEAIGWLEVTRQAPSGRFEQDFVAYLTRYTLAGAVVMIAVACGLGFAVAGGLSRPVIKAVERTKRISRGEYELEPVKPTGIREMDALSRGVEDLGRSLAGQERLRRRLMVDIAHELRTPLTVARTQIEAIADGVLEASPERLALCVSEMERLGGLIENVESLTRLEGDLLAIRPKETDLAAFLVPVLSSFAPLFERAGVALFQKLAKGLIAAVDGEQFRHVIDNLLSNALRYTPRGGRVDVRLFAGKGGEAVIEVEDTGIGIAPSDLPHVFERFYRTDESRARVTGGRGVGLAIAKATVEAHGGRISVSSQTGKGSCFTVTLA